MPVPRVRLASGSLNALLMVAGVILLAAGTCHAGRRRYISEDAGCVIHFYGDLAEEQPLILRRRDLSNKYRWVLPEGDKDHILLRSGEEVLVACPGINNRIQNFTTHPLSLLAKCTGKLSASLEVAGKIYPVRDLSCIHMSQGEILKKNVSCGPRNATLFELGFTIREKWYPLIKVCHVLQRSNTLYTQHILQGESSVRRRTPFKHTYEIGGEFFPGFSPHIAYRNANHTLLALVSSDSYIFRRLIPTNIYRGLLSPDGDFILGPYRHLTYFYINIAPQWQAVNNGNWVLLENTIRKFATKKRIDLEIATGVFQVLKLDDATGKKKQFFLYSTFAKKQMPVPKYFWKVAFHNRTSQGIAFVVLNNPFLKKISSNEKLCQNICDDSGWLRRDDRWRVISKGYLICCDVHELSKVIPYIPKFEVKKVLRGPF